MKKGTIKNFRFSRVDGNYRKWNFSIKGPPGTAWSGMLLKG